MLTSWRTSVFGNRKELADDRDAFTSIRLSRVAIRIKASTSKKPIWRRGRSITTAGTGRTTRPAIERNYALSSVQRSLSCCCCCCDVLDCLSVPEAGSWLERLLTLGKHWCCRCSFTGEYPDGNPDKWTADAAATSAARRTSRSVRREF